MMKMLPTAKVCSWLFQLKYVKHLMWEPIWGSRCISLTFFREDAQLGIQYISSSITEEEAFLQNLPKNKKFSQEANESAVI